MRSPDGQTLGAWSVELPAPERSLSVVTAQWSHDGSRILVWREVDPRWSPLLDAARPDIGAALVLVGVLGVLIGTVRILRRPRVAGRSYCRRCNHDLNAAPGQRLATERCPECGLLLGGRGAVRAHALGTRLLRVVVPSMLAIGGGVALFVTSITRTPPAMPSSAWPMPVAERVLGWPLWRTATTDLPRDPALRIDSIRVDADAVRLEGSAVLPRFQVQWLVRRDGAQMAWCSIEGAAGDKARFSWVDLSRNRSGHADIDVATLFPRLGGWTGDGRSIVAHRWRTKQPKELPQNGNRADPLEVILIDTETGAVRIAGDTLGRSVSTAPNNWRVQPSISAARTGPGACVATIVGRDSGLATGSWSGSFDLLELTVSDERGLRTTPLVQQRVEAYSFRSARITDDGLLAVEFSVPWGQSDMFLGEPIVRHFDLSDGTPKDRTSPGAATNSASTAPQSQVPSPDGSKHGELVVDRDSAGAVLRIRLEVTPATTSGAADPIDH